MLGETLTITHNAVSRVLSRINQDNFTGLYRLNIGTEEFQVTVRHLKENAAKGVTPFERHSFELQHTVFATPTVNEEVHISQFVVRTKRGTSPATALLAGKAIVGWLTDANVTKLIAWES